MGAFWRMGAACVDASARTGCHVGSWRHHARSGDVASPQGLRGDAIGRITS